MPFGEKGRSKFLYSIAPGRTSLNAAVAARHPLRATTYALAGYEFGLTMAVRTSTGGPTLLGSPGAFTWLGENCGQSPEKIVCSETLVGKLRDDSIIDRQSLR